MGILSKLAKIFKDDSRSPEEKINSLTTIVQRAYSEQNAPEVILRILREANSIWGVEDTASLLRVGEREPNTEHLVAIHTLAISSTVLSLLGEAPVPRPMRGTSHDVNITRSNTGQRAEINWVWLLWNDGSGSAA